MLMGLEKFNEKKIDFHIIHTDWSYRAVPELQIFCSSLATYDAAVHH
jgi:hypothetical protein